MPLNYIIQNDSSPDVGENDTTHCLLLNHSGTLEKYGGT